MHAILSFCYFSLETLNNCIIYKAEVSTENSSKSYIGSTATEFKSRWRNHNTSLNKRKKKKGTDTFIYPTTLAKYVWEKKDTDEEPNVKWSQLRRAVTYRCGGLKCNLCLEEKLAILMAAPNTLINKRTELLNRCPHKRKHRLISLKSEIT